jgi:hypothetical protein
MRNKRILREFLAAGLLSATAASAVESEQMIAECAILSDNQRIACLENAIRRLTGDAPAVMAESGEDWKTVTPREEPPAPPPPAATPDADESSSGTSAVTVPAEVETATDPVPPPRRQQENVALGEEQVARRNDEEEESVRVSARILEHGLVGTGRLRFTLDNGQIWQQTGDDDDRIARRIRNSTDIAVEMWQSRSGGYRMHLVEINRTLRVRRIR